MAAGKLRAVVATASLDLGIDWGDVDQVIQIGAPKGVARLLQRGGRDNHRMDEPVLLQTSDAAAELTRVWQAVQAVTIT